MKKTKEDKIHALIIEPMPDGSWNMVAMTELMESGKWRNGMTFLTSFIEVVIKANKLHVPIMTRQTMEYLSHVPDPLL